MLENYSNYNFSLFCDSWTIYVFDILTHLNFRSLVLKFWKLDSSHEL
jgi:hypothetical protein